MAKIQSYCVGKKSVSAVTLKTLEENGRRLLTTGQLRQAEPFLRRLLALDPASPAGLYLFGSLQILKGAKSKGEEFLRRCVKVAPHHFDAQFNLGALLYNRDQLTDALPFFLAACEIEPNNHNCYFSLGRTYWSLGQLDEATAALRRTLELKHDHLEAINGLGALLWTQGHPSQARLWFEAALRLQPQNQTALLGLARIYISNNDFLEGEKLVRQAEAAHGEAPAILRLMAELRARQDNFREAVGLLSKAIVADAHGPDDYLTLASWYSHFGDMNSARTVIELGIKTYGEGITSLEHALFNYQLLLCDWRQYEVGLRRVLSYIRNPAPLSAVTFTGIMTPGLTPADLLRINQAYGKSRQFDNWAVRAISPRPRDARQDQPLRIGYLSADFHQHATAYLMGSVFEHHDPTKVTIHAYSYGPDDGSPTRRRLEAAFAHFTDIRALDHGAAAQLIRDEGIDILIDLMGYMRLARTEILAMRPAPIQVNWLGYPGSMAVDFMDYIIVDKTVAPLEEASCYQEALAYMPHAYASLDPHRDVAPIPSRTEAGLPEEVIVFCCFNNPRKILPEVFHRWCRILAAVPGSVLWLYGTNSEVIANLHREAERLGIERTRLIFAHHVSQAEHLARLTQADLVLDTLPYNAHTTAADALFMGVPVLTCLGNTFAGRVAASLLRAAGLPDMVTLSLEEYQSKAIHLAASPNELAICRHQLVKARKSQPYFDVAGFTRDLERLLRRMWTRHQEGKGPCIMLPEGGL